MTTDQNGVAGTATMTVEQAEAALAAAQAAAAEAAAQRLADAKAQLATLDEQRETLVEQIRELGGTSGRGRPRGSKNRKTRKASAKSAKRGRPAGSKNKAKRAPRAKSGNSLLVDVATALSKSSEPLTNTQVAEAVVAAGRKASAASFPTMVSQSLGKLCTFRMGNSRVANSPSHGHYQAGSGMEAYLANPGDVVISAD